MSAPGSYCPFCGSYNVPGSAFCHNCGRALAAAPPSPPGALPSSPGFGPTSIPNLAPSKAVDQTATGLLLMVIGFAISWIPFVSFVGGILVLIGIIFLFLGRKAFGGVHRSSVVLGCTCILIGLLAEVGVVIWFTAALFTSADSLGQTASGFGSAAQTDLNVLLVALAVTGSLVALGYLLLPYELVERKFRPVLWGAFAASVALTVTVYAIIQPQISTAIASATSGAMINTGPISALETTELLLGALQVVPSVLFAWAYYNARKRVLSGAIQPIIGERMPQTWA